MVLMYIMRYNNALQAVVALRRSAAGVTEYNSL